MIAVDTSCWVEWLIDSPVGAKVDALLPDREQILVPTLVQLELTKWLTRTRGEEMADEVLAFTEKCQVVALDTRIALLAAEACRTHGLTTADAIIFATAQQQGVGLLTCDAHFEGLPGVTYISKKIAD
jgi:predicted nucleic acid-binding protein